MKAIYKAVSEEQALEGLAQLEEKWGKKYPNVINSWEENWTELSTFFKYSSHLRRLIYTTNPIESVNRGLRKVTKARTIFPHKEAALKAFYLAIEGISGKWTMRINGWAEIYPQLVIYFKDRLG